MSAPSFTCPRCSAVSHNPNDIANGYCGQCHAFVYDPMVIGDRREIRMVWAYREMTELGKTRLLELLEAGLDRERALKRLMRERDEES